MVFKRKIYEALKRWKESSQGKTALLIEGARRVGKSTIAEEFAKNEYESYAMIDFAFASKEVKGLFEDLSDLDRFFSGLQLYTRSSLKKRKSLVIFDEVQRFPKAREAIKLLVKDGRFDYIETGSLISIKKNVENILIPSEEVKLEMNPMDYEEFLWANGDEATYSLLSSLAEARKPFGDAINRKLMRDFRLYMLVGGMPQAVNEYLESNDFARVDEVKRSILSLYEDDFRKIDSTGRLALMFEAIPSQLNKNAKGFKAKSVLESRQYGEDTYLSLISELKDSKTVNVAYHVNNPQIDLSSYKDLSTYKIYLADTGLFVTLQFKNKAFTENDIYSKLLSDKLSANLGYLYENAVAQMLTAKGNDLFYHTFFDEVQKKNFEVDFILERKGKLYPIEVKSSHYRKHRSLDEFKTRYRALMGERYILHSKDISKDGDILCLPLYLTPFIA